VSARFLAAAFTRRPVPKAYDPAFFNVELARIQKAMPSYVIRSVTSSTALNTNDGMLVVDATSGAVTVTLMNPNLASGQPVTIKKSDSSANAVTIGGTVDGTANRTLDAQNDSIVIQSDGTTWFRPMLTASNSVPDYSSSILEVGALIVNTGTISATNVVVDGKDFSTANWTNTSVTVAVNDTTAPDGTLTADKLTTTATSGNVYQVLTGLTVSPLTCSISLKQSTGNTSDFGLYDATAGSWMLRMQITWAAGVPTAITAVAGGGVNMSATSQGSGWYLITGTTTGSYVSGNTVRLVVYPGWLGEPGFPSVKYAWDARCYPAVTAIAVTGPVSVTGTVAFSSTLAVTGVATFTAQPIMSSLTASQAVFTDASKGLVSVGVTGTGNVVRAGSPTLTGTAIVAGITYSTALGSLTAYATPGAFTQTLSSQFASTVSGATLMGYGTTGDVTLKNRAGTDALIVTANTLNVALKGAATVTGAFGCNAAAAQTAYASGGALNAYVTGGFGLDSDANMSALHAMVVSIRAALVANGVMS
jgi:hypothetical protein